MKTKKTTRKLLKLGSDEITNRQAYITSDHVQLGNLHERMKWLTGCKEALREYTEKIKDPELFTHVQALGTAVMDLETELSFHQAIDPPYSRRDPGGLIPPVPFHSRNC